jgi:hypothetical protein
MELRKIKMVKVSAGLYRSEDTSLNMHVAHRPWEPADRRWFAAWNTFMSGRQEFYGPTKSAVMSKAGVK